MRSLIPLSLYCISLFCLQIQALPTGNRLDFMKRLHQLREASSVSPQSELTVRVEGVRPSTDPVVVLDKTSLWRALLIRNQPPPFEKTTHTFNVPPTTLSVGGASDEQREKPNRGRSRGRRHAHYRGHHQHHGQLMRVGCILGTCQVQNLSHRLYQLVGQTGREDSSPINPRSPHSYG